MGIRMATPWKHPGPGNFYLRERVPTDLTATVKGRKVSVLVNGQVRQVTLGETVKLSLGTKEPKTARELYREAAAAVQEVWHRLRQEAATGPVRLTAMQVEAMAGAYYRHVCREHGDDPGDPDGWDIGIEIAADLLADRKGRERMHGGDADRLLQEAGLVADADSRSRLLEAMNRAFL